MRFIPTKSKLEFKNFSSTSTPKILEGHTDSVGTPQYNQRLSEQRAQAVAHYFAGKGVIPERLAAEGKGETAPRASNATPDGRRLNRRVEVYIEPIVAES